MRAWFFTDHAKSGSRRRSSALRSASSAGSVRSASTRSRRRRRELAWRAGRRDAPTRRPARNPRLSSSRGEPGGGRRPGRISEPSLRRGWSTRDGAAAEVLPRVRTGWQGSPVRTGQARDLARFHTTTPPHLKRAVGQRAFGLGHVRGTSPRPLPETLGQDEQVVGLDLAAPPFNAVELELWGEIKPDP